ncbi:MAG TPA: UDP-glucose 4-epimerase GalE [Rhizomicrobium sp.]|jgi:UDP-glucose 4-epimerase|nr:UDP-glucose 4-epimerase GalE [Rhizomicrobium sp.]
MAILVTGGAGYIGSHMTYGLRDRGEEVVVLDNLTTGVRALVSPEAQFVQGTIGEPGVAEMVLDQHEIEAVIHFAGSIVVPESVADPLKYYRNNTAASSALIEACIRRGVRHFIFSSTAAVYGLPASPVVAEDALPDPINPYGRSKLMTERVLQDAARAHDFHFVALRYFNVAGADPAGRTGQSTPNATHLIKRACQTALGQHPYLEIFGEDYATPDGTGVRDYIHVSDLISAHLLALDHLRAGGESSIFNVGYGRGFSVREVIATTGEVAGAEIPVRVSPRRPGDPGMLVADSTLLKERLKWRPKHHDLKAIIGTAYAWERGIAPRP